MSSGMRLEPEASFDTLNFGDATLSCTKVALSLAKSTTLAK